MTLNALLSHWKSDPSIGPNIVEWRKIPRKIPRTVPFPDWMNLFLKGAVLSKGISSLYIHQAMTWEVVRQGKNAVVVTGTASGKTLCYNLPVLNFLLQNSESRALYIFPTKALAQDQFNSLKSLINLIGTLQNNSKFPIPTSVPINCAVYDGDTAVHMRSAIRNGTRIIISNPDMLHTGILPHHTSWADFFQNLRFVVIDEVHVYRGVFGSHVANVIRRLKRIAGFYGSSPQFIITSATIGNPGELSSKLINESVELIDDDGAERGEKNFLIYNPPIIDKSLGIRKSTIQSGVSFAEDLLNYKVQSIVFSRARRTVEIILTYLRGQIENNQQIIGKNESDVKDVIRGYRSGYLPKQRRSIEEGLRKGDVKVVVTTNALELGIDIGSMDASLLIGYPGSIAATWQQAGRAGRGENKSLSMLITSPSPLDQYLAKHPDYFFEQTPEHGMINPDNLLILIGHLRCAAFELPFTKGEIFGSVSPSEMDELMDILVNEHALHKSGDTYFWMADKYPAQNISLRSASTNRILLQADSSVDVYDSPHQTIGEVDRESSLWMVHPGAIYMHEGNTFLVKELDLDNQIARLEPANVDYYTEPRQEVIIQKIEEYQQELIRGGAKSYGEIQVTSQVIGYRKIRWHTNETLGVDSLILPPSELLTTGYWLALSENTVDKLREEGLWSNAPNDYGPNWPRLRDLARARDGFRCQICGAIENIKEHQVHHKIPFRMFDSIDQANQLSNLITLCNSCHRKVETAVRVRSGLAGLAFTLGNLAPLFLMCDLGDLGIHSDPSASFAEGQPAVALYDLIAGGIGLSERIYEVHEELMMRGKELVETCGCEDGCPSCVGPGGEGGQGGKKETLALFKELTK